MGKVFITIGCAGAMLLSSAVGCGDDETTAPATAATTSASSSSSGSGGGGGGSASSSSSSTSGSGGGGGGTTEPSVHGCTRSTAVDETGSTTLQITWSFNHSRCLLVDVGTKVVWDGNFDTHPLSGGVSPTEDTSSPIDMAGPGSGTGQVEVTFDATGDYPYFCDTHFMSMTGVVYVQ